MIVICKCALQQTQTIPLIRVHQRNLKADSRWHRGVAVERWIRDRELAGSDPAGHYGIKTLGKFLTPMVSP